MDVICKNCGRVFNRTPSQVRRNKTGNLFHSKECMIEYNAKHDKPQRGGSLKNSERIRVALTCLPLGVPTKNEDIGAVLREHRIHMTAKQIGTRMAANPVMERAGPGLRKRVAA